MKTDELVDEGVDHCSVCGEVDTVEIADPEYPDQTITVCANCGSDEP